MAIGMRIWTGIVLAGMGLLTLVALPPRPLELRPIEPQLPEQARFRELSREMRVAQGILDRRALSDSLAPLVAAAGVSGIVLDGTPSVIRAGSRPAELLADSARQALAWALEKDLSGTPGLRRAAIGVVLRPPRPSAPFLHDTYLGSHEGTPYCFRVIFGAGLLRTGGDHVRANQGIDALGPCRLVARHGLPGPRILAWLEAGGIDFAAEPADELGRPAPGPGAGAVSAYRGASPTLDPDRCLAGIAEACATMFLSPTVIDEVASTARLIAGASPVVGSGSSVYRSVLGAGDDYLLSDLETEFGPERFGAFWRSDADVRTAFERAFEVPLGGWVLGWTRENIGGSERPGPALPRAASTGALVLMVLSGLVATAVASRRRPA